ncbi:MAG: hypothetical protein ACLR76_02805 [Alistipes sp.]
MFAQDGAFVYVPARRSGRLSVAGHVRSLQRGRGFALLARSLFVFERDSEAQLVIDDRSKATERRSTAGSASCSSQRRESSWSNC